jgi:hypothetical protein
MGLERGTVRTVIRSGSSEVPQLVRGEKAEPHRPRILELYATCKGNLVRVHEELIADGAAISYPALTAFCRRQGIGQPEKVPAGRYSFEPGEEMQHDTSVHEIVLAGTRRKVQTASLVLCHSRMLFFQLYPRFTRFECKVFLAEAVSYMGGACATCMIDNTHLVVLCGTGREMVPVPEMEACGERYGFAFRAHEKGDANRSARVERPFDFIENNFLAGRSFADWNDANAQARTWCERVNATFKKHLRASPRELFVVERPQLTPLPVWVPPIYVLHHRIVDIEGFVTVNTNRYSVPPSLIGRRMEVRETWERIEVFAGPRRVAAHPRVIEPAGARCLLSEHRVPRGQKPSRRGPPPEEPAILERAPELAAYVQALKQVGGGRGTLALRKLLQIVRDYPRAPVLDAVRTATHYRLYDLDRLEHMVLRRVASEYFVLPEGSED